MNKTLGRAVATSSILQPRMKYAKSGNKAYPMPKHIAGPSMVKLTLAFLLSISDPDQEEDQDHDIKMRESMKA